MDCITNLLKYQESVIESLEQENSKWDEGTASIEMQRHVDEAKHYYQKLIKMQQDVSLIQEKTNHLKSRSQKLQKEKERQAMEMEQRKRQKQETDQKLSPVMRLDSSSAHHGNS